MLELVKLKSALFFIAVTFSNPFVPDFGTQFVLALIIGLVLPCYIVKPLYDFIVSIPPVKDFEKKLAGHRHVRKLLKSKHSRLKYVIPRILAGYIVTYIIALLCGILWLILEFGGQVYPAIA
ncbi:MAG: hypothetical protein JW727_05290 [Candidatus Aenigmarchaeota archaeon]|nr:hypothetical protein [Candidatus Aenigmarchaeota archaeon]